MEESQNNQIEENTLKQLLDLEMEFREHNELMKNEMEFQKDLVARIWTVSQRYILLESAAPNSRCKEIYPTPAEDALLEEFTDKLKQINNSNCRINISLSEIRKSCLVFDSLCSQLDLRNETPLITGDAFHKPIAYFIELVADLLKYFHAWILKLKYTSQQLDPIKIDSIEHYKKQLEISEDFQDYLQLGLTYCKCLRRKTRL